jgi:probable F420-dependent oxidoreductase
VSTRDACLGLWQDRPADEALDTAREADRLGYRSLWIGEMATYDAFALGTAVGLATERIGLTLGPLAVAVRDPMMIAMGVASVAALTGRPVDVALGTSSTVVVEQWHGRSRSASATALAESLAAVRTLLSGERAQLAGQVLRTNGYRLRLPAPGASVTVAAFGPRAIEVAAAADRLVLNLVDVATAAALVAELTAAADRLGRPRPRTALWLTAAVDAGPAAVDQLRRAVVGYLGAPGYAEMFARAGFGELVGFARTRPHPGELLAAVPEALTAAVGLVGSAQQCRARIAEYEAAGIDEVVLVPASTDADPAGTRTLTALAP